MIKVANLSFTINILPHKVICPWAIYMYKISQSLNVFFCKTAYPIFTRYHCQRHVINLFKPFCIIKQDGCHVEKHLKIFSRTKKASRLTLVTEHRDSRSSVCSNDDPRLTFDLFTTQSNLRLYAFVWGKY